MQTDYLIFIVSGLILLSVFTARILNNVGLPALLLFMGVGMLAGSEGPGGIFFEDLELSKTIGTGALLVILFSGGLDTHWPNVRNSLKPALSLATTGVLITAVLTGLFAWYFLQFEIWQAFLLGSIISSTDAAAVFSVMRAKSLDLKGRLKSLLELESASNDPMAIFLTVVFIELLTVPDFSFFSLVKLFLLQWVLGGAVGYFSGRALVYTVNRLHLPYEGIYPVFMAAAAGFIYAGTALLQGSGFLAVYIAALTAGNSEFIYKRTTFRFFDGLAWMSQIMMFLTLGLLVYPSKVLPVLEEGIGVSLFLMLVARPLSVFASLAFFRFSLREMLFVSWVGLRGAVPVILAIFPLLAGIDGADKIFYIVFFIVITSAVFQGWSIPAAASFLKVKKEHVRTNAGISGALAMLEDSSKDISDIIVSFGSYADGKTLIDLKIPGNSLVILINRGGQYIIPKGSTVLEGGDVVLMLVDKNDESRVKEIFLRPGASEAAKKKSQGSAVSDTDPGSTDHSG